MKKNKKSAVSKSIIFSLVIGVLLISIIAIQKTVIDTKNKSAFVMDSQAGGPMPNPKAPKMNQNEKFIKVPDHLKNCVKDDISMWDVEIFSIVYQVPSGEIRYPPKGAMNNYTMISYGTHNGKSQSYFKMPSECQGADPKEWAKNAASDWAECRMCDTSRPVWIGKEDSYEIPGTCVLRGVDWGGNAEICYPIPNCTPGTIKPPKIPKDWKSDTFVK